MNVSISTTPKEDLFESVGLESDPSAIRLAEFISQEEEMMEATGHQEGNGLMDRIQKNFTDEEILVMAAMSIRSILQIKYEQDQISFIPSSMNDDEEEESNDN